MADGRRNPGATKIPIPLRVGDKNWEGFYNFSNVIYT